MKNGWPHCKYFKVQLFTVSQLSTVIPLENLFENQVWTAKEFQATLDHHDLHIFSTAKSTAFHFVPICNILLLHLFSAKKKVTLQMIPTATKSTTFHCVSIFHCTFAVQRIENVKVNYSFHFFTPLSLNLNCIYLQCSWDFQQVEE